MKRFVIATAVFLVLGFVGSAHAQQQTAPADPHDPEAEVQKTPSAVRASPTATTGPSDGGMMAMMMCRDMMSGQPIAADAMPGQQPMDPKLRAEMMQMRGEMMKAMGDIMMKHAKKMNGMAPSKK